MLYLKGEQGGEPKAVYLLDSDIEQLMSQLVDRRLRDHGYPIGEHAEIAKDMGFLRRRRTLTEQLSKQWWSLMLRGFMIAVGALLVIGIKGYFLL